MDIPAIALTPVQSEMVQAHGYDAATKTLAVQFKGGTTYHYAGVGPDLYESFKGAKSFGKFVNQNIKGKFTATKLAPLKRGA